MKRYVREVQPQPPQEPVQRFETDPGHQAQVDVAEFRHSLGQAVRADRGARLLPAGMAAVGSRPGAPASSRVLRGPVVVCHRGFGRPLDHRSARRAANRGDVGPREGQEGEEGEEALHEGRCWGGGWGQVFRRGSGSASD